MDFAFCEALVPFWWKLHVSTCWSLRAPRWECGGWGQDDYIVSLWICPPRNAWNICPFASPWETAGGREGGGCCQLRPGRWFTFCHNCLLILSFFFCGELEVYSIWGPYGTKLRTTRSWRSGLWSNYFSYCLSINSSSSYCEQERTSPPPTAPKRFTDNRGMPRRCCLFYDLIFGWPTIWRSIYYWFGKLRRAGKMGLLGATAHPRPPPKQPLLFSSFHFVFLPSCGVLHILN